MIAALIIVPAIDTVLVANGAHRDFAERIKVKHASGWHYGYQTCPSGDIP
jgi:hypothetical protein